MRHLNAFSICAVAIAVGIITPINAWAGSTCDAVSGNLIANCGFETGDFTGWTLSGNNLWTNVDNVAVHSGNYAAEMGPSGPGILDPDPGYDESLSQTFSDTAGVTGTLTFWLEDEMSEDANGAPFTGYSFFTAEVDGVTLVMIPNPVAQLGQYFEYTATFTTTGSDTLTFNFQNDPSYFDLDDVSVTADPAPAPEPSSLLLLGTGLAGAAGMARRRFLRG